MLILLGTYKFLNFHSKWLHLNIDRLKMDNSNMLEMGIYILLIQILLHLHIYKMNLINSNKLHLDIYKLNYLDPRLMVMNIYKLIYLDPIFLQGMYKF